MTEKRTFQSLRAAARVAAALCLAVSAFAAGAAAAPASVVEVAPGATYTVSVPVAPGASPRPLPALTLVEGGLRYSTQGMPSGECRLVGPEQSRTCAEGALTVPERLSAGLRVTSVARRAFAYECGVTRVELPATLREVGDSAFFGSGLREVTLPDGLRRVAPHCFAYCPELARVALPASLRLIDTEAFDHCPLLERCPLPDSLTYVADGAFSHCDLRELSLPSSVDSVGHRAFENNSHLAHVTLQGGLLSLGDAALRGCALTELTIPWSVRSLGRDCLALMPDLRRIVVNRRQQVPALASGDATAAQLLPGPASEPRLGSELAKGLPPMGPTVVRDRRSGAETRYLPLVEGIYYHPLGLGRCQVVGYSPTTLGANVRVPATVTIEGETLRVTRVAAEAFRGYTDLRSLELPEGLEEIGQYALCWTALEELTLPESLRSMGESALTGCESLRHVRVMGRTCPPEVGRALMVAHCLVQLIDVRSQQITDLQTAVVGNVVYLPLSPWTCEVAGYDHDHAPTRVEIPREVTVRGRSLTVEGVAPLAFADCMNLTSAHLPESVKRIGHGAFASCASLMYVHLPSGLKHLGAGCFAGCTLLPGLELPESLEEVAEGVFRASGLRSVTLPGSVVSVADRAFEACEHLRHVELQEGLHSLGRWAFSACPLPELTLPRSLERVGDNCFAGCKELKAVHTPGREGRLPGEISHGLPACCGGLGVSEK